MERAVVSTAAQALSSGMIERILAVAALWRGRCAMNVFGAGPRVSPT